jgi:hypothetical protein
MENGLPDMRTESSQLLTCRRASFLSKFVLLIVVGGTKSLGTAATSALLYKPQMIHEGDCAAIGGVKIGRGIRSTRRKTCPSATLSRARTPDRSGGKPATNRLSYGAARSHSRSTNFVRGPTRTAELIFTEFD